VHSDRTQLLGSIVTSFSIRVKWIMSSRNWQDIGKTLNNAKQKFSPPVELNKHSISSAVDTSIRYKTEELAGNIRGLRHWDKESCRTLFA
jgi:hypothetical protein